MQQAIRQLSSTSSATWVTQWIVTSPDSGKEYKVSQKADGSFACDCPAWKFKKAPRPDCKHILRVKNTEPIDYEKTTPQAAAEFIRFAGRTATAIEQQREHVANKAAAKSHRAPAPTTIPVTQTVGPVFFLQTTRSIRLED